MQPVKVPLQLSFGRPLGDLPILQQLEQKLANYTKLKVEDF